MKLAAALFGMLDSSLPYMGYYLFDIFVLGCSKGSGPIMGTFNSTIVYARWISSVSVSPSQQLQISKIVTSAFKIEVEVHNS